MAAWRREEVGDYAGAHRLLLQALALVPGDPAVLGAIGTVESGRRDPASGTLTPWPWTVNAEGQGRYFDGKAEAVAWVAQARAGN